MRTGILIVQPGGLGGVVCHYCFHVLLEDALSAAPHKAIKSDGDLTVQPTVTRLTRARSPTFSSPCRSVGSVMPVITGNRCGPSSPNVRGSVQTRRIRPALRADLKWFNTKNAYKGRPKIAHGRDQRSSVQPHRYAVTIRQPQIVSME
jgi:hypothetical protein